MSGVVRKEKDPQDQAGACDEEDVREHALEKGKEGGGSENEVL